MDLLQKHGEKLLALVLVIGVAGSFVVTQGRLDELEMSGGNAASAKLNRPKLETEALTNAVASLSGEVYALPVQTNAVTLQDRVPCTNPRLAALIPRGTEFCPYCETKQETPPDDTDGDGIPDNVEIALGLNPNDPNDAQMDLDGDGFANLREYLAETDPADPNSHPPLLPELHVVNIVHQETRLTVKTQSSLGTRDIIQVEIRYPTNASSYKKMVKTGERFGSNNEFLFKRYVKKTQIQDDRAIDVSYAVMQRGDESHNAQLKKPLVLRQSSGQLGLVVRPAFRLPVSIETEFELDGKTWIVTAITKDSISIKDKASGETKELKGKPAMEPVDTADTVDPMNKVAP